MAADGFFPRNRALAAPVDYDIGNSARPRAAFFVMLLKGCLHIHTTCSDGKLTPQQVADVYESMGYDFIAFTDHDYLLKTDYQDVYDSVRTDMLIFKGIEMTVFEKGYVHVNRIFGDTDELFIMNHLGEYDLTYDQVMERIQAVSEKFPLGAVEITTKGFLEKEFNTPAIALPKIASDDAHTRVGCGRAWIEMDCKRTKDDIIRAIKKNRFWNCFA